MKKNLLALVAFSAIVFTSCSNEMDQMVEQQNEKNVIGFSTYSMMSKGTPITGNNAGSGDNPFAKDGSSFEVVAFLNDKTNPYLRAQIMHDKTSWNYFNSLDKAYWPNGADHKLNFFAVAPYSDFYPAVPATGNTVQYSNTTDDKSMKITYAVPTITSDQQDLMYAATVPMTKPENGNVTLNFKHALNQIHFMGRTDSENLRVEIATNGIEVCNIKNSGTLTATSASSTWAANESKVNYTIETVKNNNNAAPVAINSTSAAISNSSNVLMLIPQSVIAWDLKSVASTQANSYLKINCKIWVNNGGSDQDKVYLHGSAPTSEPVSDGYKFMYVPFAGTSMDQIGKKITYTLIFGGGYTDDGKPILTPITFNTEVEGWETPINPAI